MLAAESGSDPSSLEFWEPLLWPALFMLGAVILFMLLIFVGTLVALFIRAAAGFFIFSWWRGPLTVAATALLAWTGVVTSTQVVVGWAVALVATFLSVLFLAIAGDGGAGARGRRRGPATMRCDACHGLGGYLEDGSDPCQVCHGAGELTIR